MDPAKVAQLVEVLNGLTARDGLCLLVGGILTVLDEAPSDIERQQALDNCIDLLKGCSGRATSAEPLKYWNAQLMIVRHLRQQCPQGNQRHNETVNYPWSASP
jgi:hypothetical protein